MDYDGDFFGDYEVFLSFRGKDTRQGFIDILYEYMTMADIRVFRDDDELAIGNKIDFILDAIDSSKICIPVFSPNFAKSKWCLREVTRMVEKKKMIVPVFYKVSPDDVKLKETSVYANDFMKFEHNDGDPVEIDKWENALREVVSHKGRKLGDKSYTQFCKELVNEVLLKLGPRKRLDIDDHFVGSTNKAEAIRLLDGSSSQEVVYLGIHGMGGIGKTTLTKFIYNEFLSSFDYCGFVPDIREFSANEGVNILPIHMYDNLHPKFVTPFSRSGEIHNVFRKNKVLLILDDIDSDEQIKKIARDPSWFGSGSRIILTSRDKKVFEDFESTSNCDIQYLEMKELERGWSLELFSRYVFGDTSPPSSYLDLSERAVRSAGGLPLTITVIAKYLRNQKKAVWEEIIERLHKTPSKEVKDRLMISYDSLEDEQKKIFLDIACLFNNTSYSERSHIFYMWQACELYPRWSLEVLQSRSLVKVGKGYLDFEFYIHMHDQLRDLGRDIVSAESRGDLTKQSRVWEWNGWRNVLKCKEKQKNMIETLYLDVSDPNVVLTNEEFVSFDNLRFLRALTYDQPLKLKLRGDFFNLFPKLTWLQYGGDILEVRNLAPPYLVILDLSCSNVDENWEGWSQILMSKKLKILDISFCKRLRRTPVFPKNMPLETLNLYGCYSLEYIDPSIGKLQRLTELCLHGCCKLKNLHSSIRKLMLESLKVLDLSECERVRRTPVFPENMSLESLNLNECGALEYIDPSIGKLQHLTKLDLSGNWRSTNKLRNLPDSIRGLVKLEQLKLNYTKFLVQIPESLGNLHSLQELSLVGSGLTCLPGSIIRLEKLEKLNLTDCKQLQELPKLPSSLKVLHIECGGLNNNIPDLSNLRDLTSLWIGGARFNLMGSNIGLLSMSRLLDLTLDECEAITDIPGIENLQSLTSLTIERCPSLVSLVNLDKLKQLRKLNLYECQRLVGIPGVGKLRSLTELAVEFCGSMVSLDVTGLEELKEVRLIYCPKLTKIPGLFNLKSLRCLELQGFKSREILDFASQLNKLHGFVFDSEEEDDDDDDDDSEDGDGDDIDEDDDSKDDYGEEYDDDDDDSEVDCDDDDGEEEDDDDEEEEEEYQEKIVEEWNEEEEDDEDNEALQPPKKRKK